MSFSAIVLMGGLSPAMVMPLAPARTIRLCQCFSTPNSRSANWPIWSSTCRSLTPARIRLSRSMASNNFNALAWARSSSARRLSSTGAKRLLMTGLDHRARPRSIIGCAMRWAVLCMAVMGWATQAAAAPCPCTTVFVGEAQPFIAEGIARDAATGRLFVASVATRRIVTIHDGRQDDFAQLPDDYSPLGIALSGGTLWVTAAVVAQGSGHDGPSALIALDQGDGHVRHVYPVADSGRHILNDLTFAPDGTVYASDAMDGSLYRLGPHDQVLARLGGHALLKSAQGMAVSADGK